MWICFARTDVSAAWLALAKINSIPVSQVLSFTLVLHMEATVWPTRGPDTFIEVALSNEITTALKYLEVGN